MAKTKYIIIGDGGAGINAAGYIRRNDPGGVIEIISDDPNASYYRAALTNYLIGELREDQIWSVPASFFDDLSNTRTQARVLSIDAKKSRLRISSGGRPKQYDKLLIATGSRARHPQFEGVPIQFNMTKWPVSIGSKDVGIVTSAVYSPRFENIGYAWLPIEYTGLGTSLTIHHPGKGDLRAEIVEKPFVDPKKDIPKS